MCVSVSKSVLATISFFRQGGDGDYDTCIYNDVKVDNDAWDYNGGSIDGYIGFVGFGCENPLYPRPPISDSPLCPPFSDSPLCPPIGSKKEKGSK